MLFRTDSDLALAALPEQAATNGGGIGTGDATGGEQEQKQRQCQTTIEFNIKRYYW